MARSIPGFTCERRHAIGVALLVAACGLLLAGCPPKTQLFDSGVSGTVVTQANTEAAVLARVFLADDAGNPLPNTTTRSNQAGRFRINAPKGSYHLIATDNAGNAAFTDVILADGDYLDVGLLLLQPCAPGQNPNADVYLSCPAPVPVASPPDSFSLANFAADRVQATLYSASSPSSGPTATEELFLTANDDVNGLELSIWIPSDSPYFASGSYAAETDANYPAPPGPQFVSITLAYRHPDGSQSYYVLQSGTLEVLELFPAVGGNVRLRLSNALFDWGEAGPQLDTTHTISIGGTDPVISTKLAGATTTSGVAGSPGPTPTPANANPPPGSYALGTLPPPLNVYAYPNVDGGVNVETYHDLGSGGFFALSLSIPASYDVVGTQTIANQVSGDYGTWSYQVYGQASYSPDGLSNWSYVLSSASLMVSSAGRLAGETFTGTLTGATFFYFDDVTYTSDPSLPLTLSDSGTLTGTLSSSATSGGRGTAPWGTFDSSARY